MEQNKNIRMPKQKRSIKMKEHILATAMTLICEKGFYNTTTNEIAKNAEISIGSLYSYFADKDAILLELLEQYNQSFMTIFEEINTELNISLYRTDMHKWMQYLINRLIALHEGNINFTIELNALYFNKPEVVVLMDFQEKKVKTMIADFLLQQQEFTKINNIEAVSVLIFDFISSLVDRIVFKESSVDKKCLIDTTIDMLCLYLRT